VIVTGDSPLPDVDLVVSLGGDGTMLHSIGLVGAREIPLLGVNIGHLGYLTEVEPDGLLDALARFFAGEHRLERRMTLDVSVDGHVRRALNEAVLEKTTSGHTVRLALTIDGEPLVTYAADGLIVATPTGSTAYNLSVRGPICSPTHRAIVITPVSAHMLFDRSLVLDADQVVGVQVLGDAREARLVVDGQVIGTVTAGQRVELAASKTDAALVRLGPPDFNRVLRSKFGLADR
jgi:NAD+ kinase